MSRNPADDLKGNQGRPYMDNDNPDPSGIVLKDKTRHLTNDSLGTEAFQTLQQEQNEFVSIQDNEKVQNLNDLTNIPA